MQPASLLQGRKAMEKSVLTYLLLEEYHAPLKLETLKANGVLVFISVG